MELINIDFLVNIFTGCLDNIAKDILKLSVHFTYNLLQSFLLVLQIT